MKLDSIMHVIVHDACRYVVLFLYEQGKPSLVQVQTPRGQVEYQNSQGQHKSTMTECERLIHHANGIIDDGLTKKTEEPFEIWYTLYPRHVGKSEAKKAYVKAIGAIAKSKKLEPAKAHTYLMEATQDFAESPAAAVHKFTPHPATWLNQGRYDDDRDDWYAASTAHVHNTGSRINTKGRGNV